MTLTIGKIIGKKYLILHELSSGTFSTVWICIDLANIKIYAVKILNENDFDDAEKEISIYNKLNKLNNISLLKLIDCFDIYNDDHTLIIHKCMIFDLMKGTLRTLIDSDYTTGMPVKMAINILTQLLHGLNDIHNSIHLIYADIRSENILYNGNFTNNDIYLRIQKIIDPLKKKYKILTSDKFITISKNIMIDFLKSDNSNNSNNSNNFLHISDIYDNISNNISESSKYDESNESNESNDEHDYCSESDIISDHKYSVSRKNISICIEEPPIILKKEKNIISAHNINIIPIYIININIKLADFGACINNNKKLEHDLQTRYYRAPEIILRIEISYKIDIWSIGCIIYELIMGDRLFDPDKTDQVSCDRHHIRDFYKKIGPMPIEFIDSSRKKDVFFCKDYTLKYNNFIIQNKSELIKYKIKDKLIKQNINIRKIDIINNIILSCLNYNPEKRPNINELIFKVSLINL